MWPRATLPSPSSLPLLEQHQDTQSLRRCASASLPVEAAVGQSRPFGSQSRRDPLQSYGISTGHGSLGKQFCVFCAYPHGWETN